MKTTFFTIGILLLFSSFVRAQYNYTAIPVMDYFRVEQMTEEKLVKTLTESDIEGSPYLEADFRKGTVYTTSKQMVVDIPIRYNIYNDDLEFKTPENKVLAMAHPENVELVDLGEYRLKYLDYISGKSTQKHFMKVLTDEGSATLYAMPDVFYQKEVLSDGIKPGKPAQFITKDDLFYIAVDSNPAIRIKSKKDMEEVLKNKEKEIAKFIQNENIKSKKDDLIKLVDYYNSLNK